MKQISLRFDFRVRGESCLLCESMAYPKSGYAQFTGHSHQIR